MNIAQIIMYLADAWMIFQTEETDTIAVKLEYEKTILNNGKIEWRFSVEDHNGENLFESHDGELDQAIIEAVQDIHTKLSERNKKTLEITERGDELLKKLVESR